jgi:hypothetical protein
MPEAARRKVVISGVGCLVGRRPGAGVAATLGQAQRVLVKPGSEIAGQSRGADQYRRVQDGHRHLQQQSDRCEDQTKTARAACAPTRRTETAPRRKGRRHRRSRKSRLRDGNHLLSVEEQYCPIPKSLAIASRREAATATGAACSVAARQIRLIKSRLSRYDYARQLDYLLDAVASTFLGDNSWFGELNSRLGRAHSRFVPLREFAGKGLICLTVFATKRRLRAENG